jgi:hypothetical protein
MNTDARLALIKVKIDRAKKHLRDLEFAKEKFINSNPFTPGFRPDEKPGHEGLNLWFMSHIEAIPEEVSASAGDAIHNVRSALDHLICQLVYSEGNTISNQTAFPIFKSDQIDEATLQRRLAGTSHQAKDKIRSLEPYKDGLGHHLWVLHELDIADKHHGLITTLFAVKNMSLNIDTSVAWRQATPRFALPNAGEPLEVDKPFFTCEPGTEFQSYFSFEVVINQPNVVPCKPVVWSVATLIEKVNNLIDEFKPLLR